MQFKSGDRVEIIGGLFKGTKNCFVQRAATPKDNFAGLYRTGQYLINEGNSMFIPGWEAGFWVNPEDIQVIALSDFERDFLSRLLDNPLAAEFEEHLKPDSAAAFERFKQMGFVELAAISDRWRITNAGRRALGLPRDPQID